MSMRGLIMPKEEGGHRTHILSVAMKSADFYATRARWNANLDSSVAHVVG